MNADELLIQRMRAVLIDVATEELRARIIRDDRNTSDKISANQIALERIHDRIKKFERGE